MALNTEQLKQELRNLLVAIEGGPEISSLQEKELLSWLETVETRVHPGAGRRFRRGLFQPPPPGLGGTAQGFF